MFVKTLNITDSVSNIETSTAYKYYWVRNLGTEDVSVFKASADADTNKKIILSQDEYVKIIPENNNIYFKSSSTGTTIEIYGTNTEICPFKIIEKESGDDEEIEPPGGWIKDGNAHYWVEIVTENTPIPVTAVIDEQVESNTTIDWGDGSTDTIVLDTSGIDLTHTYANTGTYVITLTAPDNRTAYINRFGGRLNNYGTITGTPYNYGGLIFVEWPTTSLIPERVFFRNHRLRSIVIPESVTDIGTKAFRSCTSLETLIIPEKVTSIGTEAFYQCTSLKSITIPESVTSIGSGAFEECDSLASITIPEGVTKVSKSTFYGCLVLRSITLPDSITSFDDYAFSGCITLEMITIPKKVTSFGYGVFSGCASLRSITIPESITSINERTFSGCALLETVTIPESVTSLDHEAFSGCALLETIAIPEGVTNIGNGAFRDCVSLTSLAIPEGVTNIGHSVFQNCSSLTSITIPESVTSIGYDAFYDCSSLQSIIIPENVTNIGSEAFYRCTSLTSIIIPENVTNIGSGAFRYCDSLQSMTVLATTPPMLGFDDAIPSTITAIYVPATSVDAYKAAENWKSFASKIQAIPA